MLSSLAKTSGVLLLLLTPLSVEATEAPLPQAGSISVLPTQNSRSEQTRPTRTSIPPVAEAVNDDIRTVCPGKGFLFIDGAYVAHNQCSTWVNGVLQLQGGQDDRRSLVQTLPQSGMGLQALLCWLPSSTNSRLVSIPEPDLNRIVSTLDDGGVAIVSPDKKAWCVPVSSGGYELLSALCEPPGPGRDALLKAAKADAPYPLDSAVQTWLTSYSPPTSFIQKAAARLSAINAVEQSNLAAVTAFQRFETWNYPMTIIGMITFVVAIGSLISVRPLEIVGDALKADDVSVNRFLWLIAAMSVIDLVWTLLAHQANHVAEVNPLGGAIINDAVRVIAFKVLATVLAIGILYRLRHSLFARKACWWACLTLALLTARWVIVSGVTV